jgi:predicted peptidase
MKRSALIIFVLIGISLNAQDLNLFENEIFVSESDTLNYRILKPLDYDPNQQYPVHLLLHGSGERGSDNTSQLTYVDQLFQKENGF